MDSADQRDTAQTIYSLADLFSRHEQHVSARQAVRATVCLLQYRLASALFCSVSGSAEQQRYTGLLWHGASATSCTQQLQVCSMVTNCPSRSF